MSEQHPPEGEPYWDDQTRNRWFFGFLAFSTAAMMVLFSPFMYVLLFATVLVVVSWPVYQTVLRWVKGRRAIASVLTIVILFVLVFGPVVSLLYVFVTQALSFVQAAIDWVASGQLDQLVGKLQAVQIPQVEETIARFTGKELDVVEAIAGPLQDGLLTVLNTAGSTLPGLIRTTGKASIDVVIFLFTAVTLYMEGPRVLEVAKNLSPMDDDYEDQLFRVFRQFANNMVIGSLATGALQGLVSGIGYAIAGVPQIVFLGICTGVFSFVPIVGTAVVWVPVTIYTAVDIGPGWAVFVALWSMVVTASVDNVVKPLFLRGGTKIHPLLIFLGVFGGLIWMGVPGVLIGPVVVAFFLALYTIYVTDFLGKHTTLQQVVEPVAQSDEAGFLERLRRSLPGVGAPGGSAPGEGGGDGPGEPDESESDEPDTADTDERSS